MDSAAPDSLRAFNLSSAKPSALTVLTSPPRKRLASFLPLPVTVGLSMDNRETIVRARTPAGPRAPQQADPRHKPLTLLSSNRTFSLASSESRGSNSRSSTRSSQSTDTSMSSVSSMSSTGRFPIIPTYPEAKLVTMVKSYPALSQDQKPRLIQVSRHNRRN